MNDDANKDPQNPHNFIVWIEQVGNLMNKFGFFGMLKNLFMICICSVVLFFVFNPKYAIDVIAEIVNTNHNNAVNRRMEVEPEIRLTLENLLYRTSADRAFVLEMHNGSQNFSGLPFAFFDMTYECVSNGVDHVYEDYQLISTGRFPFMNVVYKEGIWHGVIEDVAVMDKKLATRLGNNGVKYLIIIRLQGKSSSIGFLGLTYTVNNVPSDVPRAKNDVIRASQVISSMLDGSNIKGND